MRWAPGQTSSYLEDRRGGSGGSGFSLPIGMLPRVGGIGGLVVLVVFLLLGGTGLFGGGRTFDVDGGTGAFPGMASAGGAQRPAGADPAADMVTFVSFVLDDLQVSWSQNFTAAERDYENAHLVLFDGGVRSGCGSASSEAGPFYCSADERVYLDLGFFRELAARYEAPGDFAEAYVIAHEMGHHVQHLLGISDRVHQLQVDDPDRANELSVRLELQADCLAGVWAHSAEQRQLLEVGDLSEALAAAAAIGDDRLQRQSRGTVTPESFTHGTSEQRARWLESGFDGGSVDSCDTFSPADV